MVNAEGNGMIGIVILNYNTPTEVEKCIKQIKKTVTSQYRIYVVDNCSTDDSVAYIKENLKDDCVFVESDKNGGYSYGNNVGLKIAFQDGATALCVMNPDILVEEGCIDAMYEYINSSPKEIAVVGTRVITPEGEEGQFAYNKITLKNYLYTHKPFSIFKRLAKKVNRYQDWDNGSDDAYVFNGMVMGGCFMIRADVMNEIGYFDDDLFLFNEEDVLAYKLEERGYKTAILKNCKVIHNHHQSVKKAGSFTTMHLRISPLIVLRKYAKLNKFTYKTMLFINKVVWYTTSIWNKDYRKNKKQIKALIKKCKNF